MALHVGSDAAKTNRLKLIRPTFLNFWMDHKALVVPPLPESDEFVTDAPEATPWHEGLCEATHLVLAKDVHMIWVELDAAVAAAMACRGTIDSSGRFCVAENLDGSKPDPKEWFYVREGSASSYLWSTDAAYIASEWRKLRSFFAQAESEYPPPPDPDELEPWMDEPPPLTAEEEAEAEQDESERLLAIEVFLRKLVGDRCRHQPYVQACPKRHPNVESCGQLDRLKDVLPVDFTSIWERTEHCSDRGRARMLLRFVAQQARIYFTSAEHHLYDGATLHYLSDNAPNVEARGFQSYFVLRRPYVSLLYITELFAREVRRLKRNAIWSFMTFGEMAAFADAWEKSSPIPSTHSKLLDLLAKAKARAPAALAASQRAWVLAYAQKVHAELGPNPSSSALNDWADAIEKASRAVTNELAGTFYGDGRGVSHDGVAIVPSPISIAALFRQEECFDFSGAVDWKTVSTTLGEAIPKLCRAYFEQYCVGADLNGFSIDVPGAPSLVSWQKEASDAEAKAELNQKKLFTRMQTLLAGRFSVPLFVLELHARGIAAAKPTEDEKKWYEANFGSVTETEKDYLFDRWLIASKFWSNDWWDIKAPKDDPTAFAALKGFYVKQTSPEGSLTWLASKLGDFCSKNAEHIVEDVLAKSLPAQQEPSALFAKLEALAAKMGRFGAYFESAVAQAKRVQQGVKSAQEGVKATRQQAFSALGMWDAATSQVEAALSTQAGRDSLVLTFKHGGAEAEIATKLLASSTAGGALASLTDKELEALKGELTLQAANHKFGKVPTFAKAIFEVGQLVVTMQDFGSAWKKKGFVAVVELVPTIAANVSNAALCLRLVAHNKVTLGISSAASKLSEKLGGAFAIYGAVEFFVNGKGVWQQSMSAGDSDMFLIQSAKGGVLLLGAAMSFGATLGFVSAAVAGPIGWGVGAFVFVADAYIEDMKTEYYSRRTALKNAFTSEFAERQKVWERDRSAPAGQWISNSVYAMTQLDKGLATLWRG